MKNLKVTVNGQVFDVTVEEVDAASNTVSNKTVQSQTVTANTVNSADKEVKPTEKTEVKKETSVTTDNTGKGESVTAPMPGTVVSIAVKAGQKVSKGDLLLTFEAMKMENDIVAYRDATVLNILVNKGDNIDSGTELLTIA